MVGPFVFFDEMGPAKFAPGKGIDVRPHPHIHLATVTYLFSGEIDHRDSTGVHQTIQPGAVNWMIAGRGIVHSERTGPDERNRASELHGIQLWVALPQTHEEIEPAFEHHPADTLPELELDGVRLRLLAGSAYGATSPVRALSTLFYAEARIPAGHSIALPADHHDRAAYLVRGIVRCESEGKETEHVDRPRMLVFSPGHNVSLRAEQDAHVMLLGGAPLEGKRHMWWNFVSSSAERIERAKTDWQEGRFPKVPGDEQEFIPAP